MKDSFIPLVLFHYTSEEGLRRILHTVRLNASLREASPKDARYGNGQYLTDIRPGTMSGKYLSRRLVGVPFHAKRFTRYVAIDVEGLELIAGRKGIFVVPGNEPLDLTGRIVSTGSNL